jgi:hypothetical protein
MATTQTTSDRRRAPRAPDDAHTLPRWVNVIQDNLFLSFLILAEAYLLGTLMTLGWVADIEAPSRWGTYHGVGVVLFFLAGAMAAGVALRCSVKAAGCFSRHEWGMATFNFLGLVLFSGAEIWASLSERSANLAPTPADRAVLSILGVSLAPVSPTVVVVAFLLPFASLYYGFSQQQRRETEEERAEQAAAEDFALKRRLARAEAAATRRAVQVGGLAAAVRAGVQAVRAGEPAAGPLGPDGSDGSDGSVGMMQAEGAPLTSAEEHAAEEEWRRPLGLARSLAPQPRRAETRHA